MRIEKFWIKEGTTLYKFLDILKGNFATFLRQFLGKLVKNYPKNRKLLWENFEIIWRNYKIIILGTFWKFLGKYVRLVSFVKQILNYLLKTLNFWIKEKYRYGKFFDIDTIKLDPGCWSSDLVIYDLRVTISDCACGEEPSCNQEHNFDLNDWIHLL